MASLEVEFTGLCLYAPIKNGAGVKEVNVFMPDGRRTIANPMHADGEKGKPHVGYLRVNLANIANISALGINVAEGSPLGGPQCEIVYQFNRQELDFGFTDTSITYENLGVPSFKKIYADANLAPSPDLMEVDLSKVPKDLLFRTTLRGGSIHGLRGSGNWKFPGVANGGGQDYGGQFSEVIVWKRSIAGAVTLTLRGFDKRNVQQLILAPTAGDDTVRVKIANLCEVNPLEWPGLPLHVERERDDDFKWLYRLLPKGKPLHVPVLAGSQGLGVEDCLGGGFDDE